MTALGDEDFARVLTGAQEGDEAAFAELFRAVQPLLLRYLRTLAGPLAEDVAAETWIRVVKDLRKFSGDLGGFRAWVFTIARHRWVDARRAASRRPPEAYADAEVLADVPATEQVAEVVEESVSTEAALRLIAMLPPDQAEAVLLRVVAGLDVERAAKVMGKKAGHVRVLAHRGLKRLAGLLAEDAVTESETRTVGQV